MDMQGARQLAIGQQQAWDALNDPGVLKICIPGCDSIEATGEAPTPSSTRSRSAPWPPNSRAPSIWPT